MHTLLITHSVNQMGGVRHVIAKCFESIFIDIENFGIFPSM